MAENGATSPQTDTFSNIWITLITRASYLPGVVLLIHSLYKHHSIHPILVQYTSQLPSDSVDCLRELQHIYPLLRIQLVDPIGLPEGLIPVATRFDDTLTKLRAFQPLDNAPILGMLNLPQSPKQACFLDADILILRNMDDIFNVPRPDPARTIAASYACVCNIDSDPWAEPDWNPTNCAFTPFTQANNHIAARDKIKPTHRLCNSGVFVFTPSLELWHAIEDFRAKDPRVQDFAFPDQNFLDVFFWDRWTVMPWYFNAVKTLRYNHPKLWKDEEVRALHYIVDKPWAKRIGKSGVAGFKGRDGVTHQWWWEEYAQWEKEMESMGVLGAGWAPILREVAEPLRD